MPRLKDQSNRLGFNLISAPLRSTQGAVRYWHGRSVVYKWTLLMGWWVAVFVILACRVDGDGSTPD